MKKEKINLTLTKESKMILRQEANRLGLSVSAFLEYLSRQPIKPKEDPNEITDEQINRSEVLQKHRSKN